MLSKQETSQNAIARFHLNPILKTVSRRHVSANLEAIVLVSVLLFPPMHRSATGMEYPSTGEQMAFADWTVVTLADTLMATTLTTICHKIVIIKMRHAKMMIGAARDQL